MKSIKTAVLINTFLLGSGTALAECPSFLNADQMYDCIVVENAGGYYKIPDELRSKQLATQQPAEIKADPSDKTAMSESSTGNN